MASGKPTDILSEIHDVTVCILCLDHFKEPHSLPCLHVFCAQCLDKLISRTAEDGWFPCPICRYLCIAFPAGSQGFPRAFLQASLCETVKKFKELKLTGQAHCSVCLKNGETAAGSWFCSDCVETMCETCHKVHRQLLASHRLMPCENLDREDIQSAMKTAGDKCEKHGEPIKFYCEPCQRSMCVTCAILEPDTHPKKELAEVAEQCRRRLETKTVDFHLRMEAYSEYVKKAKRTLGSNRRRADAVKAEVDKHTLFMVNRLKQNQVYINHQLDELVKEEMLIIETLIETLLWEMSQLKTCFNHIKTILSHGTDANVIDSCQKDMEIFERTLQTLGPNHPVPRFDPRLQVPNDKQVEDVMSTLVGKRSGKRLLSKLDGKYDTQSGAGVRNAAAAAAAASAVKANAVNTNAVNVNGVNNNAVNVNATAANVAGSATASAADINISTAITSDCDYKADGQTKQALEYNVNPPGPLYTECSNTPTVCDGQGNQFELEQDVDLGYRIHVKNKDGTTLGYIDPQSDSKLCACGLFLKEDGDLYVHLTSGFRKIFNHVMYTIY